jgi:hypothetical protein
LILGMIATLVMCLEGGPCSAETPKSADTPKADPALRDRFFQNAPAAWDRYKAFARRLQGSADHVTYNGGSDKAPVRDHVRYEFRQSGGWTRSVLEELGPLLGPQMPAGQARVVNSRYAFELQRPARGAPWVLTQLDLDLSDGKPLDPEDRRRSVLSALCPLLQVRSRDLADLVKDPDFRIKAVSTVPGPNPDLVRVAFSGVAKTRLQRALWVRADGEFVLDSLRDWVVKESRFDAELIAGQRVRFHVVNEYRDGPQSHPLPTRSTTLAEFGAGEQKAAEFTVSTFEFFEQESIPEGEFTLSAFGFAEPPGAGRGPPWSLWLLLAGVGCLAVMAALHWRARRTSAAPPAGA